WSRRLLVALSLVMIVLAPVACDGSGSTLRGMARSESRAPVRDFAERRAVRVRHGPARAAVGAGAVWVATARGVARVGTHAVWVATGTEGDAVTRIDASNGSTHRIHVQASAYPDGVAIGRRSVWVLSSNRGALYRVDPRRLRRVGAPLSIGDLADGLAAGAG